MEIAVIGLGLIGTSLTLALKKAGGCSLSGWNRNHSVVENLLFVGQLDFTNEDVREVIKDADISILCLPVPQIVQFLNEHALDFKTGSIVSDVGSVKGIVHNAAGKLGNGCEFIGGHPMAGSEKSGSSFARNDLFVGANVFLTGSSDSEAMYTMNELWSSIGGKPMEIEPELHDSLLARSSHLPHILATVLRQTVVGDGGDSEAIQASCAGSFRDMTRIADSSPELWSGIFDSNKENVLDAIEMFSGCLEQMKHAIKSGDRRLVEDLMRFNS